MKLQIGRIDVLHNPDAECLVPGTVRSPVAVGVPVNRQGRGADCENLQDDPALEEETGLIRGRMPAGEGHVEAGGLVDRGKRGDARIFTVPKTGDRA